MASKKSSVTWPSCLGLASAIFVGLPALAQLNSIESESLKIVYPGPTFSYVVRHIAACSENALQFHRDLYDYTPSQQVTIFLEDFSDFGHGGANTVPTNFVNFGVAPFNYVYDIVPAIDRMYWMANHEMAHIVTMDQATGRDESFRRLFGGKVAPTADNPLSIPYNYLTSPRWNAPRWYHEGIAVFLETWMAGGLGRVMGGYDEMVFRGMVRDDAYFYDVVGLESEGTTIDFQVGVNSYLYGTRFMSYLAYRYGPERLVQWTRRGEGSRPYFADQFEHVYGTSLNEEWQRWIEWEHEWQRRNLEAIRKNPTTPFRQLSSTTLGSVSRAFFDPEARKVYVAIRYPGQLAHLAALDIDDGSLERLTNIKGPALFYVTSLAWDPEARDLYYTSDNYGWRDLYVHHLDTGKTERLLRDVRLGDLTFNRADRSLWGVRHYAGISTLVRLPHPYREWDQIHSFPYGRDLYEIDISPDGSTLVGALAKVDGQQELIRLDISELMAGEVKPEILFDFEHSSPSNFTFSSDGRQLFGSSYYSGVSNIYRYDLDKDEIFILTNAETGFFRPVPVSEGEILVFRYTGKGFVPGLAPNQTLDTVSAIRFLGNAIAEKHPLVRSWKVPSPATVDTEAMVSDLESYNAFKQIRFNTAYPIVEGFRDSESVGVRLNFSDHLNLSGLDLTLSYSPDDDLEDSEKIHFVSDFHYWNWKVRATYNGGDFYDLFGPTERGREGYSLGFDYGKTLWYDEPRAWRFNAGLTGWGHLETLPDYQNVAATTDQLIMAHAGVEYEFLQKSLGAVDDEKGIRWQIRAVGNYTESTANPLLFTNFDYGFPLPIHHSSVFLRSSVGHSFGDVQESSDLFFFGGFGNNYVDHLSEKRYREFYSFPGVELNEIPARSYGKVMLEWNLPPVRFRHVGSRSLYLNWMRPAVFSTVLRADPGDATFGDDRTILNFGAQLDFRMVLFSNLSTTLSLGYAVAVEEDQPSDEEFMISLKIL